MIGMYIVAYLVHELLYHNMFDHEIYSKGIGQQKSVGLKVSISMIDYYLFCIILRILSFKKIHLNSQEQPQNLLYALLSKGTVIHVKCVLF